MLTDDLLRLWGKTDKTNPDNYHPLLFHLLDVGHVIQRMWRDVLPLNTRQRIADALGLQIDDAERLIVLLGAQHDLGKASAFQQKSSPLWEQLKDVGLSIVMPIDHPHGFVSSKSLCSLVREGTGGWSASVATIEFLARITGGHHGEFPNRRELQNIKNATLGEEPWTQARKDLLDELRRVLYGDLPIVTVGCELSDAVALPLIGGLISVADWIGSSQTHFPPAGPQPLDRYAARSRKQAAQALDDFGWTPQPAFAAAASFKSLFGFDQPTPLQTKAADIIETASGPFLLLVEAAMGTGKTEVAFFGADCTMARGGANGFYMAMPTQATGNAMFDRVHEFLSERGHAGRLNLQLAHSGALLSKAFSSLRLAALYDDVANAEGTADANGTMGRVIAEEWFSGNKRTLLATFGVGTIDQGLIGVLKTRHWFVRLFGLAGKVVIFDEVHAYDVYTGALLERLISWLRALDCTVILLSATLPAAKRAALLEAWTGNPKPVTNGTYPRLTFAGVDSLAQNVEIGDDPNAVPDPRPPVTLCWRAPQPDRVFHQLREDLLQGGCAAIICNTVANAQTMYRRFREPFENDGWQVSLFHARFPAVWRSEREKQTLDRFGKKSVLDRRQDRNLIIATQVLEQSLDLDFDWMASEMAPIDLLLQRLGRLWRHWQPLERQRATNVRKFTVLCDEENELPKYPLYSDIVYEEYVLLRSWLKLKAHGATMNLPGDIDPLVQSVYDPDCVISMSEAAQATLAKTREAMKRKEQEHLSKAKKALWPLPSDGLENILNFGSKLDQDALTFWDSDDPRVHEDVRVATRLGDPSIIVVCLGTAEEGEPLGVLPKGKPTMDEARALRGFSLPLSQKAIYHALADADPPETWRENSLLRYCRPIKFDQGKANLAGYNLRLSRREGLAIEKESKPTEE